MGRWLRMVKSLTRAATAGAYLLKPNLREFLQLTGTVEHTLSNDVSRVDTVVLSTRGLEHWEETVKDVNAERILFGTDSSTFPRGYRADILQEQLRALDIAGASESETEHVMGGNLRRLLPD